MAHIVAGMATSHAFALADPASWDAFLESNRQGYARRYGEKPPLHPRAAQESDQDLAQRYAAVRRGHDTLRERLREAKVDALIVVGDDQNENFLDEVPAIAMYVGGEFSILEHRDAEPRPYPAHPALARHLYEQSIEAGFDVTAYRRFPEGVLKAHAIGPVLAKINPEADIPVVPIFVEAIHVPAPSPARCYAFGKALRQAVEAWDGGERVAVCGSGGLSHFTAGYPYAHLNALGNGQHGYGSISEEFDRTLLERMADGKGEALAELTSEDLLRHGDVEFRSWLTVLGMVGSTPAEILAYEPFYRAVMGMGVAYWDATPVAA